MNKTWTIQPFDNDTPTPTRKLEEERYAYCISVSYKYACCISLMLQAEQTGAWQHNWILTEFVTILHNMTRAHATTICQVKTRLHSISTSTNGNTSVTVCLVHMLLLPPEYQYQKCTSYCHQKSLLRDRPSARLYRFRKA